MCVRIQIIMICASLRDIWVFVVFVLPGYRYADAWVPQAGCGTRLPRLCKQQSGCPSWARHRHDGLSRIVVLAKWKRRRTAISKEYRQSHISVDNITNKMQTSHGHLMGVPESPGDSNGGVASSSSTGSNGDRGSDSGNADCIRSEKNLQPAQKLQAVDFTTTLLLVRELQRTVVPSRVETVYQLGPHDVALSLRTLERNMWLRISWHPKGARCHVGGPPPREKEQKAYTFSQTLRALLRGLNIVAVELARPFERVISLDFASRLDTPPAYRLYVEIMASRSNAILVAVEEGGKETVAACAYQVSPTKSVRPLSTGQPYQLPPAMTSRRPSLDEPLEDFTERVVRVPTQQLKKALVSVYQGTSPMLIGVMASRVYGLTAATKVGDVTPEQWKSLHSGPWRRWLLVVADGSASVSPDNGPESAGGDDVYAITSPWIAGDGSSYYPTTLAEDQGRAVGDEIPGTQVSVARGLDYHDRSGGEATGSHLQVVLETYYGATQSNMEFDTLKRRCVSRVMATLAKLRERVADFEGQLAAAQEDKVSELNRRGDLLITFGHVWRHGDTCVECEDFETGERISIELKPDKTPVETAQEAYKLGKKLKRSAAVVRELLDQAKAQVLYAEGIEMALEQLYGGDKSGFESSSREELSVLRGIAEELGLLGGASAWRKFTAAFGVKQVQSGADGRGRRAGTSKGKRGGGGTKKSGTKGGGGWGSKGKAESQTAALLQLRREAESPHVLVGRNNLQNEWITFSLGRAHELWFHARGVAGAHVLLRLEPGQDAEDDDLAFAADVAVYFSKARQSTNAAVDYISPNAVKKLGSAGPGMVKYDGAKVVRGVPSRVEALVAEAMRSREDLAR